MFGQGQYGSRTFQAPWGLILGDKHTYRDHRLDQFPPAGVVETALRNEVAKAQYDRLYGLIEYLLRHPATPAYFRESVERALTAARAPYRVLDGDTLLPLVSDEAAQAVRGAVEQSASARLDGARQHLKNSASLLGAGQWAASVRESIHAVESVALVLSPGSDTLGPALKALEEKMELHEALKRGFSAIYGFTSDESGIRHALLEKGDADVDETDALFMLSACAAFVSYLIGKGKDAGLV